MGLNNWKLKIDALHMQNMNKSLVVKILFISLLNASLAKIAVAQTVKTSAVYQPANRVQTANGLLEGTAVAGGIRVFKGVPYAAPPVGALRWLAPQPAPRWTNVRPATHFGPRAMQLPLFSDMNFRSNGVSEDCLYLNVWTPAKAARDKLPVLVYFYGGGFVAGDGSEPRYDGESMARQGVVAVTVNYRLGVFGFLAHPDLSRESPHHASGNYGLLDQSAALQWVQQNIAAFGGDPAQVTIAGESAGSYSVSAQMASPLSKTLFARAIGESGSLLTLGPGPLPLAEAEQNGTAFAASIGAISLAALRAVPGQQLLDATGQSGAPRFTVAVDGYFLTQSPVATFAGGQQAHVPLLVGWNSQEMGYQALLGAEPPTPENFYQAVQKLYGSRAEEVLRLYPAATAPEAAQSATDLASDRFIAYGTWKWADMHGQTGGQPVYRYLFGRSRPATTAKTGSAPVTSAGGGSKQAATAPELPAQGAVHSAEIEYALGNLATNKVYAWTPNDYGVSETMQHYFANFIKTGNPNGHGLPSWPAAKSGTDAQVLYLNVTTRAEPEQHRVRYLFMDQQPAK